jgi:Ca2+-binding EF-hand superfamily protein
MKDRYTSILIIVAAMFVGMISIDRAAALQKASNPRQADTVALGEDEVKQLLLLMDTDKNGKVSKQEFMKFMEAEFDRLDKDKSGELDPKELSQSRLRPATFAKVGK